MIDDDLERLETSDPIVRYSAKELFAQINKKLDIVLALVESKASQAELDRVSGRVERNESRLQTLEDRGGNRLEVVKAFAWVVGTMIGALTAITGLGLLVHALLS